MLGFKNALFVDRRIYDAKGTWKNPKQDIADVVFYFVSSPLTISPEWKNGRQQLVETMEITVFGEKPIAVRDIIVLKDGAEYEIVKIIINYFEPNILIKDMLKQRIESQILTLE